MSRRSSQRYRCADNHRRQQLQSAQLAQSTARHGWAQIGSRFPVAHRSNLPAVMLDDRDQSLRHRKTEEERAKLFPLSNGGRIGDSLSNSARSLPLRPPVGPILLNKRRLVTGQAPVLGGEAHIENFSPSLSSHPDPSAREPFQILQGLSWHQGVSGRFFPPGLFLGRVGRSHLSLLPERFDTSNSVHLPCGRPAVLANIS